MPRKIFLTGLVLIGILLIAGWCPEEKCKRLYPDLCKEPDQPTPGPIIDLEPKPDNPSQLDWRADGVVQVADGVSVFDNGCKLRMDFIGKEELIFKFFLLDNSEMGKPKKWELISSDDNIRLEVKKDAYKRLYWTLTKKVPGDTLVCSLVPGPVTAGQVPVEFGQFKTDSLKEIDSSPATPGKNIQIQVDVINP